MSEKEPENRDPGQPEERADEPSSSAPEEAQSDAAGDVDSASVDERVDESQTSGEDTPESEAEPEVAPAPAEEPMSAAESVTDPEPEAEVAPEPAEEPVSAVEPVTDPEPEAESAEALAAEEAEPATVQPDEEEQAGSLVNAEDVAVEEQPSEDDLGAAADEEPVDDEAVEAEQEDGSDEQAVPAAVPPASKAPKPAAAAREPRARETKPSRRTSSREVRRRRSARRKSQKRLVYGIAGSLVAAILVLSIGIGSFIAFLDPPTSTLPLVGTEVETLPATDLEPGATYDDYNSTPPTSGPSYTEGVAWGGHDEQQPDEAVVRNLHDGAVVVSYNLSDETVINNLKTVVEDFTRYPACYVLHPYDELPEGTIAMTAWGWIQTFTEVESDDMRAFARDHRNNGPAYFGVDCVTPPPTETPSSTTTPTPSGAETPTATQTPTAVETATPEPTPTGAAE